jgi:hypothetical protein
VIAAYCTQAATCCGVTFSTAECEGNLADVGTVPFTTLGLLFAGVASTNVTLDQTAAASCIAAFSTLSCGDNDASVLAALNATCTGALEPGLAAGGAGCLTSFDCPGGTYCGPITGNSPSNGDPTLGPTPSCIPLGTQGSACEDEVYSSDCAYQGDATGLYCSSNNQCAAALPTNDSCDDTAQNEECTSGLCVDLMPGTFSDYTCEGEAPLFVVNGENVCLEWTN